MLAILLLVIGVLSRLMIHSSNFTPVIALALFGGMYLKKQEALWMPLALMIVSDIFLGMHGMIVFTWGSILLISVMGGWRKEKRSLAVVAGKTLTAAVLFFVVTNFGSWLAMYPKTFEGFISCYIAAIPFFRNTLASTVIYSVVLVGAYELIANRVSETKFAWIVGVR